MIFGNPDTFAIYVDEIKHWSLDREINGIVGIYINRKFFLTNYGLISLYNEFEDILKKLDNLPCNQSLFDLSDIELLKFMLIERYPNWCADSEKEWEKNLNNWNDCEENFKFDLSLESFSTGHIESFHLFGVKSSDNKIKLIFYIKNDLKDFFDFSSLEISNVLSVIINFNHYILIIHELVIFLKNIGVLIQNIKATNYGEL